jgi:hypothetical protein
MSTGSLPQTPCFGQTYLTAYRDNYGDAFDGGQTYRLHVTGRSKITSS